MFSKNFYYRIKYQLKKKANFDVFLNFFLDRLKHPFIQYKKKRLSKLHQSFLKNKKTSEDYFSINVYYWDLILNKYFKEFSYLEIGSWEGSSALYILNNYKTKKVYCVDVWDKDEKYEELYKKNFNNFLHNMEEFKDRYFFFKERSDDFFKKNDEYFDLIYIDGTHESFQVDKDINNAWKFLNLNGIIICDDFFYGNLYSGLNEDVPANSINKFIKKQQNKLKVLCVNNSQVFLRKISN